jgi:hypothetical protein
MGRIPNLIWRRSRHGHANGKSPNSFPPQQSSNRNLQSLIAVQTALPQALVPVGITFLVFIQNLGASVALILANTIFTQTLIKKLPVYAPSVSSEQALAAGGSAAAVRNLVAPGHENEIQGVLVAYSESLRNVWYFLVGAAVVQFFIAWQTGWLDVRKGKSGQESEARADESKVEEEEATKNSEAEK